MSKDIKDYLHLYLECEVIAIHPADESPTKGYLTGIHGEYEAEIQFFNEDGINVSEEPEYNRYTQVKPILRQLSDITEEELIYTVKYFEPNMEISKEAIQRALIKTRDLGINAIQFQEELPAIKVFEYTKWLLSKHFDLFGLIESGLAIDKTKLNNEQNVAPKLITKK